uniref:Uncharacterized protein n=1 Tax=Triticum urartu TaxID=4572 RepID=A0A8R7UQ82_TRIUA
MGCRGHRQGKLTILGVVSKHKEDTGNDITYFDAWTIRRTKNDKDKDPLHPKRDWISSKARSDGENYTEKLKETYGPDADPHVLPFDPLVAIVAACGRPNGRMAVHLDSVITFSLPRVNTLRAMSIGSTPTVERHIPHFMSIIEDIQT